jgi:hypothetical protein
MLNWLAVISRFLLIATVPVLLMPSFAAAQTNIYRSLNAPFYEAGSSDSNCSVSSISSSTDLSASMRSAITKLKPEYVAASEKTGVPWQLLAAVHYRENNNNPNGDMQAGNKIGGPYPRASTAYARYGYPKTMAESAEIAARMLIDISQGGVVKKPINTPNPDPEAIKDTLFSYNGRASVYEKQAADLGFDPAKQPYEGSPYVMNNFDAIHQQMKIITRDFGGLDGIDTRLGAFTVYSRLGGSSGSVETCSSDGAVLGDAVQTAIKYAWPNHSKPNFFEFKPAYKTATNAAIEKKEYVGGGENPGIDCGGFVTRVMRDSGADPEYNSYNGPTTAQQKYMDDNPGKYKKLTNVTGTADLKPGDIAINSEHTYMFVGSQPGFYGNSASASYSSRGTSWRTPMADNAYGFTSFSWYRLTR